LGKEINIFKFFLGRIEDTKISFQDELTFK